MRLSSFLYGVSLAALLSGCALGPDFHRPEAPQTQGYDSSALPASTAAADNPHGASQKFANGGDIPAEWWTVFQSEPLNALIKKAIQANPDLATAEASLRQAQETASARYGILFPEVDGSFNSARQKTSKAANGGIAPGSIYNLHTATVSVSYGIDLWGASRRAIEELDASTDYYRYQLNAAYLSLTSNVVSAAIQEASLRGQIQATRKIIEQEDKQIAVTQQQLDLGAINKAPLLALQATRDQTRATLPDLEKQLDQNRHLLSVLTGQLPSQAPQATFDLASLHLPETLPVTLPSQLVEQRPDILAAEANLHAASAAIGVAIAARLPQLTLSADIGSEANNLDKLFGPGGGIWSFGAGVTQTLFDAGSLAHKQGSAEAAYDVAAAQYRKTVLSAFQDVADVLRALQADAETLQARVAAEKTAHDSLDLTQSQYKAGFSSYLNVLSAEQTEQQTQIALVQAEAQRYADTAALFQALGGGWTKRETMTEISSAADPSAARGDKE